VLRGLVIVSYLVLIIFSIERHFLVELAAGTISILSLLAMSFVREKKIEKHKDDYALFSNTKKFSCNVCRINQPNTSHCYKCDGCVSQLHRHSLLFGCIGQRKIMLYFIFNASNLIVFAFFALQTLVRL